MSYYEKFNMDKAVELQLIYKKKRQREKERFISELILYQNNLNDTSIVGINITLVHHYNMKTVESVLSDLNYKLRLFSEKKNVRDHSKSITFSFISKY